MSANAPYKSKINITTANPNPDINPVQNIALFFNKNHQVAVELWRFGHTGFQFPKLPIQLLYYLHWL